MVIAAAMLVGITFLAICFNSDVSSAPPIFYPVYGNQVSSENCRRLIASERLRMLHSADSLLDEKRWQTDSLKLVKRLKETLDEEYPLPELRQSVTYQRQWESLQQEAFRQLQQIRFLIQQR